MASYALGNPKQRKVTLGWLKSVCFVGCCIILPSSMADFVPCGTIMQRAHCSDHPANLLHCAKIRIKISFITLFNQFWLYLSRSSNQSPAASVIGSLANTRDKRWFAKISSAFTWFPRYLNSYGMRKCRIDLGTSSKTDLFRKTWIKYYVILHISIYKHVTWII